LGRPSESKATEHNASDLEQILRLYLAWFGNGTTRGPSFNEKAQKNRGIPSGEDQPNILEIEHRALIFLSEVLSPDVPVQFALSLIESIAYVTSRFAAADRRNGPLYKDAALQILRGGLNLV